MIFSHKEVLNVVIKTPVPLEAPMALRRRPNSMNVSTIVEWVCSFHYRKRVNVGAT